MAPDWIAIAPLVLVRLISPPPMLANTSTNCWARPLTSITPCGPTLTPLPLPLAVALNPLAVALNVPPGRTTDVSILTDPPVMVIQERGGSAVVPLLFVKLTG